MQARNNIGLGTVSELTDPKTIRYINLKLALLGFPTVAASPDPEFDEMTAALLQRQHETDRLLADYLCPADQRIQVFLNDYLKETGLAIKLPGRTFVLDRYGLARVLSLPPDGDELTSEHVRSYRVKQGVLHNPQADRRTTQGIFHIAEGGLGILDVSVITSRSDSSSVSLGAYSTIRTWSLPRKCFVPRCRIATFSRTAWRTCLRPTSASPGVISTMAAFRRLVRR